MAGTTGRSGRRPKPTARKELAGNRLAGNASDLYTMIKNFSGISLGSDLAPRGVWKTDSKTTQNRKQQSNYVASAIRTTAISEAVYPWN